MMSDPASIFALAVFVGILGLVVLIMPLLILFWSQMEPQLVGMVRGHAGQQDDEYGSLAVLPKLMKTFGNLAERSGSGAGAASGKAQPRREPATARAKARVTSKTVKAAPVRTRKTATVAAAKTGAKPKSKPRAKAKASASAPTRAKAGEGNPAKRVAKASAAAKSNSKPKPMPETPAGAKRDPIFGVVYSKRPKEIDDLKEIKGVAKVIEGKLHEAGIYTFRQIVEWDAKAIDAFSGKLSFKGRIHKEGWQQQCAKFHAAKYGEKIG